MPAKRDSQGKIRNYKKEYAASRTPQRRADNIKRKRDRRAYEKRNGKIPSGMELDHTKPLGGSAKRATGKNSTRAVPKSTNRKKQPKRK